MLGVGAADGVAIGRVYLFHDESPVFSRLNIDDTDKELSRLDTSLAAAHEQIAEIMRKAEAAGGSDNADIFDYQLLILEDVDFTDKVKNKIAGEKINCEYAVQAVCDEYIALFSKMDNGYLKERVGDMTDIKKRLLCALTGAEYQSLSELPKDTILAAYDLTPSQTAELDSKLVKGILLEKDGKLSHTVILARSMGVPCIVGLGGLLNNLAQGSAVVMDGKSGEVIENPDNSQIELYTKVRLEIEKKNKELEQYRHCRGVTLDGREVGIYANITSVGEVGRLLANGGEGVGLLRTELIYMASKTPPSEETQYRIYSQMASSLKGRPLIIRTLDAGGDKNIDYLGIEKEANPFLGVRAIRYCLATPEIFKTQISAILRAAVHGNIYLMFPMIATIEELRSAKTIVGEVRAELEMNKTEYGAIRIGMMMEMPSAAFLAQSFAKEVDFFSIGTNDLTQYLFAADRGNVKVAYLNSYFHPALLNTVYKIIQAANENDIEVEICGQAGEIPELVPLWAAMGITNLSVTIPSIPLVRKIICRTDIRQAQERLRQILLMDTAGEVGEFLRRGGEH